MAFLEAHKFTCEGLLPLDGDVIIFVGSPMGDKFCRKSGGILCTEGNFCKIESADRSWNTVSGKQ